MQLPHRLLPAALLLGSVGASAAGCPAGSSRVGSGAQLFGCVAPSGRLVRVGGTVAGAGGFAVDVEAMSTVDGCSEGSSLRIDTTARSDALSATRRLTCGTDPTWHPDSTQRSATVTDTFSLSPPSAEGGLPSLRWNATWTSSEGAMWTAPLSSTLTLTNFSDKPPLSWVGGPSSAKAQLSSTFSPLTPIPLGQCDKGQACTSAPQPCPGGKGRSFCVSNASAGQCDGPPQACPPCPGGPREEDECHYWYGGALTDLQWRQGIVDANQQGKELLDAPSLALPIATLLDSTRGIGVSFLQSARDHPVSMKMKTAPADGNGATFTFSRQYHRLGGGSPPVSFSQSLLLHEDCFRPALQWFDETFSDILRIDSVRDAMLSRFGRF